MSAAAEVFFLFYAQELSYKDMRRIVKNGERVKYH